MNITAARKQLHEISKSNPESQNFNSFQFNSNTQQQTLKSKFQHQNLTKKQPHSKQAYDRFLKQQCSRIIAQKQTNHQKVQSKIPVFKNKKTDKFSFSQKQRYQKLGLQQFLNEDIPQKTTSKSPLQPEQQKIIKNLNNTYFRTTENTGTKRKDMVNTLGIKKSSMSNYKVEWNGQDHQQLEIQWKEIKYIPNKVFPCRKNSNVKSRIYTPKNNELNKSNSNVKTKDKQIFAQINKIKNSSSVSLLQNKQLALRTSRMTEKSFSYSKKSPQKHKIEEFYIQSSKTLNTSQQLFTKRQKIFKQSESLRPKSQNRMRPLTSRNQNRNKNILINSSNFMRQRRHSQSHNMSFKHFKEYLEKQKEVKKPIYVNKYQQINTGVIVGQKININR